MAASSPKSLEPNFNEIENINEGMDDQTALARRGAELIEEEMKLSILASVKYHWRAMIYCSAAFSVGSMFGYDVIVNGGTLAMPAFLLYFGKKGPTGLYLSSNWTALWTAMSNLAQAVGGILAAPIIDRFGRKYPAMLSGALTIAGTAAQYYSTSNGVLLLGKMINGFGVGAAFAIGTTYASEIAPQRLRAQVQSALILFMVIMQTLALGVLRIFVPNIAESSFRTVFAIQWAVGGLVVIAFLFVPESPTYLIKAGKIEGARSTIQALYGRENSVDARLAYLTQTVRENASHKNQEATYINCFRGNNLKRTMTALFTQMAVSLSGGSFLAQGGYFLVSAGLPAIHTFDVTLGGFGLAIIFIIVSWFVMDKIGRRVIFISGSVLNTLGMIIIGACYYASGMAPLWVIAILMNFLISWQSVTMVSTGWIIVAELSTYSLRAKTQSLSVATQAIATWFFNFIMPYIYNVDAGNLGARTGFIFMGTGIIFSISAWYLIPDTAGLKVEEVDWLYSQRIAPRTFQARAKDAKENLRAEASEKGELQV